MAEKLKAQLETRGFEVEMTRPTSQRVPLGQELEIIGNSEAQLLISISVSHNDDFKDLGGFRILYPSRDVDYSSLKIKTYDASEIVDADQVYVPFGKNSETLASSIRNSLTPSIGREAIGINPAPLYYAKRAPMPATTVIIGYMSNPKDIRRLTDPTQQDALATSLAEGITEYGKLLERGSAGGKE